MKTVILISLLFANALIAAASPSPATQAVNALGIDLLRATSKTNENALLSPYSIQSALAMTYAGAAGVTRDEMKKVLHFPDDATALHSSFANLRTQFADEVTASAKSSAPLFLNVANRLYAQCDYDFKPTFFNLLKKKYETSLEQVDFRKNAPAITTDINQWVEKQTHQRIHDLIPSGALKDSTRLVLVNALYFKAKWTTPFSKEETKPEPFKIAGGSPQDVPTMVQQAEIGTARFDGGRVITMPYLNDDLQFVILLPDPTNSLVELRAILTPDLFQRLTFLKRQDLILHLPKFKFEPPTIRLSESLEALGMPTAFDRPIGTADFSEMAARSPGHYLYISDVFHKTFIEVDEGGTEAAASTAVAVSRNEAVIVRPQPFEVKVDRPFLFAIQHRASGACLFLGQVVDPRGTR